MKYEVGDEIIIKLTQEEGKVIEILNDKMVMITVKGVQFPAYVDQIDFPYFYRFTKQKIVAPKPIKQYIDAVKREKPKPLQKIDNGVWLHLLPILSTDDFGDDVIHFFKIYVVNETAQLLQFDYRLYLQGSEVFQLKNELLPFHDFYIHDVAIEDFSNSPKFNFIFSLKNADKTRAPYFEVQYKVKGKQVFQQLNTMKEVGAASIRHQLYKEYPAIVETPEQFDLSKLANAGLKVVDAKSYKNNLPPPRTVIDIHIEKLVHDHRHLSNTEIMEIQMKEFEKWYDIAVLQNAPMLIVVHGVGDGVLRNEVHEFLKYKREVKSFVNQYHPSFGYGATEITFNRK